MATKKKSYPKYEKGVGLLVDHGTSLGHFSSTPKYMDHSDNSERMARFFIPDTLAEAVKKRYSRNSSDPLIRALNGGGYFEFLISGISDSSSDRYQLVETLGKDFVVFGLGESPEIISCTGILKNTKEDDWKVKFLEFFKNIGGVSALASFYGDNVKNFLTFKYDSNYKRGALLNVSHSLSAHSEMDIPFTFTFLVTKTINFNQSAARTGINNVDSMEKSILNGSNLSPKTITSSGMIVFNGGNINRKTPKSNPVAAAKAQALAKATTAPQISTAVAYSTTQKQTSGFLDDILGE